MLMDRNRESLPVLRTAFLNAAVPINPIRSFHDGSAEIAALTETPNRLSPPMNSLHRST
jgi:hypothetical protein